MNGDVEVNDPKLSIPESGNKGWDIYLEQVVDGDKPKASWKKYRDAEERILSIERNFGDPEILDYLFGTDYNYSTW